MKKRRKHSNFFLILLCMVMILTTTYYGEPASYTAFAQGKQSDTEYNEGNTVLSDEGKPISGSLENPENVSSHSKKMMEFTEGSSDLEEGNLEEGKDVTETEETEESESTDPPEESGDGTIAEEEKTTESAGEQGSGQTEGTDAATGDPQEGDEDKTSLTDEVVDSPEEQETESEENQETIGEEDNEENADKPAVLKNASRKITISLQLAGGNFQETVEKWVAADEKNETYTYTVVPENSSENSLTLPVPVREGYTFGGWKKTDGTVITAEDTGGYTLELEGVTEDLTLTAVWQQYSYSIDITKATYTLPKSNGSANTLMLTHYDKDGDIPDIKGDILPFLNENAKTLSLDYTISYKGDEGTEQTVRRSNVKLSIEWNWKGWTNGQNPESNEDFREVEEYLKTSYNGDTKNVYLSENYLKQLIVAYEETQNLYNQMTKDNIAFSNWGTWNESKQQYTGGDVSTTALKIKLGSIYNKNSGISGNEDYMIDTVSPSNVHVNLFDYWQSAPFYSDLSSDTYTSALNKDHGFVFKFGGVDGAWNNWPQAGGDVKEGIVKRLLDNGFPKLDLSHFNQSTIGGKPYDSDESLQYLFDPNMFNNGEYGRAYSDVTGLFKINEDGNYYYSSHDNFAEYNYADNSFNVYNVGGVKPSGSSPHGQFFPFNTADQVFTIGNNGQLQDSKVASASSDATIDHYLGLSMSVDFQQPIDGMVSVGENAKPMTFKFSGDDDVWIFIDDVLVADLGGIHDEASVEIDFSTGKITRYLTSNPEKNQHENTLREMFKAAGKTDVAFNGDTFAGNTTHTLKMFYLERGNYDSNLTLSFNLMEPVDSQIIKLDQDGNAVQNAKFALYVAKLDDNGQPILGNDKGTYEITGQAIFSNLETDTEGQVTIPANYDFSQHTYYVLREKAPDGYFGPGDVLLKYDKYEKHPDGISSGTNLLLVDNRWTTGAVGNFTATIYQSGDLHYDNETDPIEPETGQNGLILAVPMMKGADGSWRPLYGSNMAGFNTVSDTDSQKAALKAALYQIFGTKYGEESEDNYSYGFQKWYMEWDEDMDRYQGVLNDLPGDATSYYWASGSVDTDMSVDYYFLDLEKLTGVFDDITEETGEEKLASIAETIYDEAGNSTDQGAVTDAVNKIVTEVLGSSNKTFGLLDVSLFNRTFASRIYVPNTQPDLRVRKLDQDGNAIPNVEFSLFMDSNCNSKAIASGKTDNEGLLIFSETGTGAQGSAFVNFEGNTTYYLKETTTPEEYTGTEEIIPVYVTTDGRVYADALGANDGITVRKGLGKLVQTMAKYAGDGSIDGTLRDITGKLFTVENFSDIDSAIQNNVGGNGEELNFCYGATNAILEYGTHKINGVYPNPYFEVDEGIAGIIVHQNYYAHQGDALYDTYAKKTELNNDVNIRALFTGSTTVVVRNRETNLKGSFSIKKTVSGSDIPENATFDFTVKIEENESATADTIDSNKNYEYTVTDKQNQKLETGTIQFVDSETDGWEIKIVTVDGNSNTSSYIKEEKGKYYIQLQADQMIRVTGIPFGLKVTAKETEKSSSGYQTSVSVNNGQWSSATEASGIVEEPIGNPFFVFNNHKDRVSNLVLKKTVLNEETEKEFNFHITLSTADGGETLTGNYKWQVQGKDDQAVTGENHSGTITDGRLDVALKSGEQVVISDLPIDSKYLITEDTMGYSPSVEINGQKQQVQNGSVSGSIEAGTDTDSQDNIVDYSNVRSGSITITKRTGTGTLLSGAGFTLYSVNTETGDKIPVKGEIMTALAIRTEIADNDAGFNKDAMRYNDGTSSYIVHENEEKNAYFYYRFLTEAERNQYYSGTLQNSENVEAIVQFDGLDLSLTYAIEETTVPQGYVQNAAMEETMSEIHLPLEEENTNAYYDILYTVTNHKQLILPTTGLKGIAAILGIGVVLIGAAIALWRFRKRAKIQ